MDSNVIVAIASTLPPTIAAIGALIVGIRNSTKTDTIHSLVNSNLSAVKTDLALALQRVDALTALVTQLSGGNRADPPHDLVEPLPIPTAPTNPKEPPPPYKPGV